LNLLDYWLKTGRFNEVLRATSAPASASLSPAQDLRLLEIRIQALLARGEYRPARQCVDRWLMRHEAEGQAGTRLETDVESMRYLRRHLRTLERMQGPAGKPLFTGSVPDSLRHWSQRREVPAYFFKLIPAHVGGQKPATLLPGRMDVEPFFQDQVAALNRGFQHLSGGAFSLAFQKLETLYVNDGDIDATASGGHILTSRVYMHTLPSLAQLCGKAFIVLVDYRASAKDEAAYMGDGIVYVSASKLQSMVLMHEILHGLGATHQDWAALEAKGYRFDREDRGLMTFDRGEIKDLGLEEKNRALLGWPQVSRLRFHISDVASSAVNPGSDAGSALLADLPLN
jgi:hypothetical protein